MSEASYLRSLNVAVDHFQRSAELQAMLTNQERQWLFSRLSDVRDVSARWDMALCFQVQQAHGASSRNTSHSPSACSLFKADTAPGDDTNTAWKGIFAFLGDRAV